MICGYDSNQIQKTGFTAGYPRVIGREELNIEFEDSAELALVHLGIDDQLIVMQTASKLTEAMVQQRMALETRQ